MDKVNRINVEKSVDNDTIEKPDNDYKIKEYINQLNPLQQVAYEIAKKQLKSSFTVEKSIGFIQYEKDN